MFVGKNILVTGASGFIGSHLVDELIARGAKVYGIDNFTRGRKSNLHKAFDSAHFNFLEADISKKENWLHQVEKAWDIPFQAIFHMAANSDISAGISDPEIDLRDTFMTTYESLGFARRKSVPDFIFASTSAIYGSHDCPLQEETGPCLPISYYGAMKLASEGIISAATESYLSKSWLFRFPNVVGGRATHGIIYDLLDKIDRNPKSFEVLGDGSQRKPYLHVQELVEAMLFCYEHGPEKVNCYNIGANENNTSVKTIAEAVKNHYSPNSEIVYSGGNKGWTGDVPQVVFSTAKINKLGWKPKISSDQAMLKALKEIIEEKRQGQY